ncbi:GINS complex, Sld5 component [Aaosphaeria arxii CBS 175.79]|uniref:DNA replication complex GINS protein SLD5 n=1 Tax=Aaosphaeria arxii CBS 175.79 TaxID=1450172 RepID=A0A6A5XHD1_9PLEO|nr:GINS complex, Sld5 component [Aaosphaeria arxii CBS 175.79]KAF2012211.1 GINS complex, Sld5 component [Aaosphaeria arxii CBS 175.79]
MDISDLLASVVAPPTPSHQRLSDLQSLTRSFVAERTCPELLPYPSALLDRVLEAIREQIETIEEHAGDADPRTNFRMIILQTELERVRFLVRGLVRGRIAKIDAHPLHILNLYTTSQPTLLSPSEHKYLTTHQALLSSHFSASFLSQFPAALQRLDDTTGGVSMVDKPDEDRAVFVRCLRDVGQVYVEGTGTRFEMRRGDVSVVRWSAIRAWVLGGDVELI